MDTIQEFYKIDFQNRIKIKVESSKEILALHLIKQQIFCFVFHKIVKFRVPHF